MKKRIYLIVLVLLLCASLMACQSKNEKEQQPEESTTVLSSEDGETEKDSTNDDANADADDGEDNVSVDLKQAGRIGELMAEFEKETSIKPYKMDSVLNGEDFDVPAIPLDIFSDDLNVESVSYQNNAKVDKNFINKTQSADQMRFYGEHWSFDIVLSDKVSDSEDRNIILPRVFKAYREHLEKEGAEPIGIEETNQILVSKGDLIIHLFRESDYIRVSIVKERPIALNKPFTIKTSDYKDGEAIFVLDLPVDEYVYSEVQMDKGAFTNQLYQNRVSGRYTCRLNNFIYYDEEEGLDFVNYDFPYLPGRTIVKFDWKEEENKPNKINYVVKSEGKINSVRFGEELGAIRLTSEQVESVSVKMVLGDDITIEHPQVNIDDIYFDRTPENGYFAFVPAGLYHLKIDTTDSIANGFYTVRVPVNAGQVTDVIVPENFTDSITDTEIAGIEQGIDIQDVARVESKENVVKVVFTLLDDEVKSIEPSKENMSAYESGIEGTVLDVKLIPTPPDVVLLLDSSGSMEGQMEATIEAAKEFINGLPENASVQVVDFDTTVKPIKAQNKEEIITALTGIIAEGATALDDSIAYGLGQLADSKRPIVVAFTDGEDAITEGVRGSKISREELLDKINSSDIPIYTIGFGEGHDSSSLELFSDLSNGYYFPADNQDALKEVFAAINEKIGSTYEMTYKRPEKIGVSNVPVLAFVVDVSGSMNMTKEEQEQYGYDYERVLDDVKRIYAQVVKELPDNVKMELITFSEDVYVSQCITQDKLQFLSALGAVKAYGGTNILDSINTGYESIDAIESKQKAMIYLTDAALEVKEEDQETLDKIYSDIRDKKINSLWIGIGTDKSEPFEEAAEKTGGRYIVSEDPETIKKEIMETLSKIHVEEKQEPVLTIGIEKRAEDGSYKKFNTSQITELPELPTSDEVNTIDGIRYVLSENVSTKSKEMANLVYGDEYSKSYSFDRNTEIAMRMPLADKKQREQSTEESDKKSDDSNTYFEQKDKQETRSKVSVEASNEAMKLEAFEIISMSKLLGVYAPAGMKFVGVSLAATNIMPEQEVIVYKDGSGHPANWVNSSEKGEVVHTKIPYLIKDYTAHFALAYNNEGPYLANIATGLAAKPLVAPNEIGLQLNPDQTEEGMLIFLVPDEALKQAALYYYDDNYGYITLPLVGKAEMIEGEFEVDTANNMPMGNLFDLELKKREFETEKIDDNNYNYQTLTLNLVSKIQGKLNVNLQELMLLTYPTKNGAYFIPMSSKTNNTPQGIKGPLALAHGSRNTAKAVYSAPKYLKDNEAELYIDLATGSSEFEIAKGTKKPAKKIKTFHHEYFDVDVNGVYRKGDHLFVLDLTVHEKEDQFSTRGITSFLNVLRDKSEADDLSGGDKGLSGFASNENYGYSDANSIFPHRGLDLVSDNDDIILSLKDNSIIYDGTSRRGILVYNASSDILENSVYIQTPDELFEITPDMVSEIDLAYLEKFVEYGKDSDYENALKEALVYAANRYEKMYPNREKMKVADLEKASDPVVIPSINSYGKRLKESVKTTDDVARIVKSLRVIPRETDLFQYFYSSDATLTQGFGSIGDVAKVALDLFESMGVKTALRTVELTERGKELLGKYTEIEHSVYRLPAIGYLDEKGNDHLMVIPFGLDLKDLSSFCYISTTVPYEPGQRAVNVKVEYLVKQTKDGHNAQIGGMAAALGGQTEEPKFFWTEGFNKWLLTDELSKSPIDIGFSENGGKLTTMISTADNMYTGDNPIELRHYKIIGVRIKVNDDVCYAKAEDGIENLFFTLGIQMPELPKKAAKYISKKLKQYKDSNPNAYDALRWRHQKIIYDYIAAQTAFEKGLADDLKLQTGRLSSPYAIVVKSEKKKKDIVTSVDLMNVFNTVYSPFISEEKEEQGDKFEENQKMFNTMSGIFATENEAEALVEGEGFYQIFSARPKSSELLLFRSSDMGNYHEKFIDMGLSEEIVAYLEECEKMILIPTEPSVINGEERWAWLEIDEYNYKTIGVLDTFQRGAMTSNAVLNQELERMQYVVGAFKGVETSVWAVGGFSLKLTDYKEIVASAKKLALGIAESFGASAGPIGVDVGGELPGGNDIAKGLMEWFGVGDIVGEPEEENKGFKEGYLDGVKAYFTLVEKTMED